MAPSQLSICRGQPGQFTTPVLASTFNVGLPLAYPHILLGLCGYPIVGQKPRFQFFNLLEIHPRNGARLLPPHPPNSPIFK